MIRAVHTQAHCALVVLLLALATAGAVSAQQTTAFTYQGRLTDAGAPANNNYDLQFTLWDSVLGGNQQPQPAAATLTKSNVAVTGGVFSVLLDFGVSAFPGADRFLEIGVRPGGTAVAFTLLAPRQQISSTPYAIRTLNATAADSLSSACVGCVTDTQINSVAASKLTGTIPPSSLPAGGSFIQNQNTATPQAANFNISGNGIIGGNVGVGANNPSTKLDVRGNLTLDPSSSPVLYTSSTGGEQNRFLQLINSPTMPSASGLKAGGILVADSYGFANPGKNDLIVKGNVGIGFSTPSYRMELRTPSGSYGFVHSTPDLFVPGRGVLPGVRVGSLAGAGPQGAGGGWLGTLSNDPLHFFVNSGGPSMTISTNGNVGIGTVTPTASKLQVQDTGVETAVYGTTNSLFAGVVGENTNKGFAGIGNVGVLGLSGNSGLQDFALLQQNTGVKGESSGLGVVGRGTDAGVLGFGRQVGVYAESFTINGAAVEGVNRANLTTGQAGRFFGRVDILGDLTSSSATIFGDLSVQGRKNFKIDHPLDPANKYLYHAAIESSEVLNIYSGNVTTDEKGDAAVTLPDWFEAVNRDFRYQLTVIGTFAQAIIADEVHQNRFRIKTNAPKVKVSWQVTALRSDAGMRKRPFVVEEEKPAAERGTYLDPEAFGQPAEKSVTRALQAGLSPQSKAEQTKKQN